MEVTREEFDALQKRTEDLSEMVNALKGVLLKEKGVPDWRQEIRRMADEAARDPEAWNRKMKNDVPRNLNRKAKA